MMASLKCRTHPHASVAVLRLNGSIIILLLLSSPLFMMLGCQMTVEAIPVTSTTTQTATIFITMTGSGATTLYETDTFFTSVPTVTATTYTTSGLVTVPVPMTTVVAHTVYSTYVGVGVGNALVLTTQLVNVWVTLTGGGITIVEPHAAYSTTMSM
jgi:hypothetical protein